MYNSSCNLSKVTYSYASDSDLLSKVASGILFADAALCLALAFISHYKYTSVTVLNYSVNTKATSNTRWIWFFIFTTISSLTIALNLLGNFDGDEDKTKALFITGWIAHLLAVLSLAFAIKYQWKYREEAFNEMRKKDETTPILPKRESKHSSVGDALLLLCAAIAIGCFIVGSIFLEKNGDKEFVKIFYWIAFSFNWLIRIAIFIMVFIVYYKLSQEGPSVFTKCLLLGGVFFSTPRDIPLYIWIECIMTHHSNSGKRNAEASYDALVGVVLLSHLAFFVVLRGEFLRLKDITRWHVVGNLDKLENNREAATL